LLNTRPIQTPMKTKNQNFSKINKTQIINFLNKKNQQQKNLPMNEKILIQFVMDINSNIVVCCYINSRTWKLTIDSNDLNKQWEILPKNPLPNSL
jgi:hypothetical protein